MTADQQNRIRSLTVSIQCLNLCVRPVIDGSSPNNPAHDEKVQRLDGWKLIHKMSTELHGSCTELISAVKIVHVEGKRIKYRMFKETGTLLLFVEFKFQKDKNISISGIWSKSSEHSSKCQKQSVCVFESVALALKERNEDK